jgi:6-pyruvoyltetrahydropterin/6-carboxytetrahydropterin synthase
MKVIRITKEFSFEMAHALDGHDGKCKGIHGHSYQLDVTLIGEPIDTAGHPKLGMLIDFSDLKKIVKEEIINEFDHALALYEHDPLVKSWNHSGTRLILTPYQPTCENLISDFAARLKKRIPSPLTLHSLRLRETDTSYAEWFAADN